MVDISHIFMMEAINRLLNIMIPLISGGIINNTGLMGMFLIGDGPHYPQDRPISTQNMYAPLSDQASYDRGDFLGPRRGQVPAPPIYKPNPGEWWRQPPQQSQHTPPSMGPLRKRKEREEREGVGN